MDSNCCMGRQRSSFRPRARSCVALAFSRNLPFFKKQIIVSNDWEKSIALKIGGICIKYSFDKLVKYLDVRDTEITEPEFNENVAIALARTTNQTHTSTNIIKLESRKGNNERAIHKSSI